MSLYGRTDSSANVTKAGRGIAATSQAKTTVFVDETEAQLNETKSRGITGPGWWSYFTYTDSSGATRHKAEQLVFIANADGTETLEDDTIAADETVIITINNFPSSIAAPVGGPFSIVMDAISTPPGDASEVQYQWQKKSGKRWTNIGANQPTYDVASYVEADDAGQYRVKLTTTTGAKEVVSTVVTVITT